MVTENLQSCVLILYISGGTYSLKSTGNDRFLEEPFHGHFIYTLNFCQKSAGKRQLPKKYFFHISFCCRYLSLGFERWPQAPMYLQIFEEPVHINFIYTQSFCQKSNEKWQLPKKYFFHISFGCRCQKWGFERWPQPRMKLQIFVKPFPGNFIQTLNFRQKSAEKWQLPKKYFFPISFFWRFLSWSLNGGLRSKMPTMNLQIFMKPFPGNFIYSLNIFQKPAEEWQSPKEYFFHFRFVGDV